MVLFFTFCAKNFFNISHFLSASPLSHGKMKICSLRMRSPIRKRPRDSHTSKRTSTITPVNDLFLPNDVFEHILRCPNLSCEDVVNASRVCKSMNIGNARITQILVDKRFASMKSKLLKYHNMAYDLVKKSTTPLHDAVEYGCVDIVENLCENLLECDKKDRLGMTPLMVAAEEGADAIVKVLLKYGADVNAVDKEFESALFRACYCGKIRTIKTLVSNGADLHSKAHDGVSCLYIAVVEGYYEVVEYLLDMGADPNMADDEGCTPLVIAIREEHDEMVNLLLSRGADINVRLLDGNYLLHYAVEIESLSMVRLLLEKGINIHELNSDGRTALNLSNFVGNQQVFEYMNGFIMKRLGHAVWE